MSARNTRNGARERTKKRSRWGSMDDSVAASTSFQSCHELCHHSSGPKDCSAPFRNLRLQRAMEKKKAVGVVGATKMMANLIRPCSARQD